MTRKTSGALLMSCTPRPGTPWTLREALPRQGQEYTAVVIRQWHEEDGRSFVEMEQEDGEKTVFEVWVRRGRQ